MGVKLVEKELGENEILSIQETLDSRTVGCWIEGTERMNE